MKFPVAAALLTAAFVSANKEERKLRKHSRKPKYDICGKKNYKKDVPKQSGPVTSQQFLLDNGIISKLPTSLCTAGTGKNVILVIGDGMGWEMARAGAIAKRVLDELTGLGVDTVNGSTGAVADAAKAAFAGRQLKDYYLEGKCCFSLVEPIWFYPSSSLMSYLFLLLVDWIRQGFWFVLSDPPWIWVGRDLCYDDWYSRPW